MDPNGQTRPDSIVDMGADEYHYHLGAFNGVGIVNFLDYALFADAWQNQNSSRSLDGDRDVDIYDLKFFCEDWLWQAGWTKTFIRHIPGGFTCGAGEGMGQTMAAGFAPVETSLQSISAEQQIEKVEPLKIEQMITWLEELWLDEETQKVIDKDIWLRFIESLKEEL
jgi:hypothetical protein